MIRAFIFDLDGTLVDSRAANVQAYRKAFEVAGIAFDEALYRELFGLRFAEMMRALAPDATTEQIEQISQAKPRFYQEAFELLIPNNGLIALLGAIRSSYKTALVTTATSENALNVLNHLKLSEASFDVIITGEQVNEGKPNPECYVQAIKRLGIQADECCIFEDSGVGVQAATLAGTQVIRVRL